MVVCHIFASFFREDSFNEKPPILQIFKQKLPCVVGIT
jgi:hypothetical protein